MKYVQDLFLLKRNGWILSGALSLTMLISLSWNWQQVEKQVHELALNGLKLSFEKDVVYRRWAANHGGVYVPVSEHTQPNPYLNHIPERDVITPSGVSMTLVNPAYMTRQVYELSSKQYGIQSHITSLKPLRPENIPDEWEEQVLKSFDEGAKEAIIVMEIDGSPYMRLMRPFFTDEGCLKCHGHQGYKVGDIRGGISVSIPILSYLAHIKSRQYALFAGHGIIWIAGLIFIGFMTSRIVAARVAGEEKRKCAEELLRHEFSFRNAIIDNIAQGLCVCNNTDTYPFVKFTVWNDRMTEITGYTLDEINRLGWYQSLYSDPEVQTKVIERMNKMRQNDNLIGEEWEITRADGNKRILSISSSNIEFNDGVGHVLAIMQDITERKQAEEFTKASLKEKETLLKEIHHRVKNNMQVIVSLLNLQIAQNKDEHVKQALIDCQGRINSMGSVHEMLYMSKSLSDIDCHAYISKLSCDILQSFHPGLHRIKLTVDAKGITLGIRQALPLGLIINELLSNALKYGYPENRHGKIMIRLKVFEQNIIEFVFSDNGIGIPENLDWRNTKSLGLNLIVLLAEKQLGGTVRLDRQIGTCFTIRFNLENNQP